LLQSENMFHIIFSIHLATLLAKYFYSDVDMFHLYIRRRPDWYNVYDFDPLLKNMVLQISSYKILK